MSGPTKIEDDGYRGRVCTDCAFCFGDGEGYSDYTWMDTSVKCVLGLNPQFPIDGYVDHDSQQFKWVWKENRFASDCPSFREPYVDVNEFPTTTPEGNCATGSDRFAMMARLLSKTA